MTVGADKRLTGNAETLDVYLMADAVAGFTDENAVLERHGLNISVVVGVFKARLNGIVVYVRHRTQRLYLVDAQCLEL